MLNQNLFLCVNVRKVDKNGCAAYNTVLCRTFRFCTDRNGAPELHRVLVSAHAEQRALPGQQKRRERVLLHTDCYIFLRSLPLWDYVGLFPLKTQREEQGQHLYALGARRRAARVGGAPEETQPRLPGRCLPAAGGAGVPSVLRYPRQPLRTRPLRGRAAVPVGVRALHWAEQRQLPVLVRGHTLRDRGRVGQRHGGGEQEGGVREQRRWLWLRAHRKTAQFDTSRGENITWRKAQKVPARLYAETKEFKTTKWF